MTEQELVKEASQLGRWQQHKFLLLVGITIVIALVLVIISLQLYNSSGAAQLDLSRPGYKSVRSQVSYGSEFTGFPSSGPLDKEAIDSFRSLYSEKLKEATALDSFGGDVLSDKALGLEVEVPTQAQD